MALAAAGSKAFRVRRWGRGGGKRRRAAKEQDDEMKKRAGGVGSWPVSREAPAATGHPHNFVVDSGVRDSGDFLIRLA